MLFKSVLIAFAAASAAFGAAVADTTTFDDSLDAFNPDVQPLATPVYEEDVEIPLTNAERLRKGLAPLPPRIKTKRFGLNAPGPQIPANAPEPSAAPPTPSGGINTEPELKYEGIIQVTDAKDGKILGYVGETMTKLGQFSVDRNYRKPLEVSFGTTRANQKPGNMLITNGDSRSGKFFGAVASQKMAKGKMTKGSNAFSYLARTGETKSGLGPLNIKHSLKAMLGLRLKAESAIWTIADQFTGELASSWTNTGGEVKNTAVFWHKSANALAIAADAKAFKAVHKDAVEVKLTIINKPFY